MQQYKVYNMYLCTFAMFENRVRAIISYHTTSMAAALEKKPCTSSFLSSVIHFRTSSELEAFFAAINCCDVKLLKKEKEICNDLAVLLM